jgi:hypothetical protein
MTHGWWDELVSWVPDLLQIGITFATVVFVVARAYNEVDKILQRLKDKRDLERLETRDDA